MPDELASALIKAGFRLIETHISRVFLRGADVYKIKRAVDLGFLDFTTLAKRERACQAELTLNRRLAPDVYLDVSALVREGEGLAFRRREELGAAEVLEWAVHMRRLRDEERADVLLGSGAFERADVERIASLLARFHEHARVDEETAAFGAPSVIASNVEENFRQTAATIGEYLAPRECEELVAYQRGFLREHAGLFEQRARAGFVRDGHGDLRLEHCYRTPSGDYLAIDCIEFNDRFRYADVCADVAFLAMDLSYHGRADLSELLIAAYARERGDYGLYALLDFYQSYRAVVRAKVASLLAHDREVSERARERAQHETRRYYVLAISAARRPLPPVRCIVSFGLIASGKSTLAARLADRLAVPVLSADLTRKELLGLAPEQARPDAAFQGAYAPEMSERVYGRLLERAEQVLRSGRSVVLDATFRARSQRARVSELAARLGVEASFLECRCSRGEVMRRLRARAAGPSVSDGRAEIFDAFADSFEPASELPSSQHVILDTHGPASVTLERALTSLGFDGHARLT